MRPATVIALLGILVLTANAQLVLNEAREVEQLQGEWLLVSTADEKRVSPGSEHCKMVLAADGSVLLKVADRTTNRGTITASRSGKARLADLKLTTGLFMGVYELKGDELLLCFDEAGKARPAGMTPRGTQWVERWRRARREGP